MDAGYLRRLAELIAQSSKSNKGYGPRSRIVEAIAILLYAKPMRASEIASILGFNSRYVSSYLSYWKSRGLFRYENGYWMLTERGVEYAKEVIKRYEEQRGERYIALAKSILAANTFSARIGKEEYHLPGQYREFLPILAEKAERQEMQEAERRNRERCVQRLLEGYAKLLPSDEHEVLRAVLEHYAEWGKTYLYADQLQEKLRADPGWLLSLVRKLQAKGLIYVYHDKRMGIRIGISKQLRNMLDNCLGLR